MTVSEKTWTYDEITQCAEKCVNALTVPLHGDSEEDICLRRSWAFGVYLGWSWLTVGHQKEGDAERIERLASGDAT